MTNLKEDDKAWWAYVKSRRGPYDSTNDYRFNAESTKETFLAGRNSKPDVKWVKIDDVPEEWLNGQKLWIFNENEYDCDMGFYGNCELLGLTDTEAENIDEDSFFFDSWWSFDIDGAHRLVEDTMPTHVMKPYAP